MADTTYCYPNGVLINKLNISDKSRLEEAERRLTMVRLMELQISPIMGNFSFSHLRKIHHHIFQDIYPWAGEIRTVDIAKSQLFCLVQFIGDEGDRIFASLKEDNYLQGRPPEDFVVGMARYFSDINALHPFREGNGRAQREFFRVLALNSGYGLDFRDITHQEMVEASVNSIQGKYGDIEALFKKALYLMEE